MTLEQAEQIIWTYNSLVDESCSCHMHPPCSRCTDMPSQEEVHDAEKILEANETLKKVLHKYEKESSKLKRLKGQVLPNGAWTINLDKHILSDYDIIIYETSKFTYKIYVDLAIEHGEKVILGNECKLVVPIEHWETNKND